MRSFVSAVLQHCGAAVFNFRHDLRSRGGNCPDYDGKGRVLDKERRLQSLFFTIILIRRGFFRARHERDTNLSTPAELFGTSVLPEAMDFQAIVMAWRTVAWSAWSSLTRVQPLLPREPLTGSNSPAEFSMRSCFRRARGAERPGRHAPEAWGRFAADTEIGHVEMAPLDAATETKGEIAKLSLRHHGRTLPLRRLLQSSSSFKPTHRIPKIDGFRPDTAAVTRRVTERSGWPEQSADRRVNAERRECVGDLRKPPWKEAEGDENRNGFGGLCEAGGEEERFFPAHRRFHLSLFGEDCIGQGNLHR